MKRLLVAAFAVAAIYLGVAQTDALRQFAAIPDTQTAGEPRGTLHEWKSGAQVMGEGTVTKLLADDNEGSRHQRFILTLRSGQTLLITHNIDLAPRIASLKIGDSVAFSGVYEWNPKGGVVHWTHHDPQGRHQPGWIKHAGRTYQ